MTIDQLLSLLQGCLQPVGQQNQLVITPATFNDARITQLIGAYYGGSSLVLTAVTMSKNTTDASQVVVTGKGSFLNVVDMPVTALFQVSSDTTVDLALRYQLPPTWKFSQSFATLPATWAPSSGLLSATGASCSVLDLLTFTGASFLLSTMLYTDQTYQVQLSPGLNFACYLSPQGLFGAIEQAIAFPSSLVLAGPIIMSSSSPNTNLPTPSLPSSLRNFAPLPGINLKADVRVDLSLGPITLKDVYLIFYSPLAENVSGDHYEPGLCLGGTLQFAETLVVEVIAKKTLGIDNLLTLSGAFDTSALPGLSQFASLTGGDDVLKSLIPPGTVPPFFVHSGLSVQSVSLTVACSPLSITAASLVAGLGGTRWSPLDGFAVDGLEVFFGIDHPFGAQRSVQVAFYGTLHARGISVDMSALMPDFTITALLPHGQSVPLQAFLPADFSATPEIAGLTIDAFYLEVQPATGLMLSAALADGSQPWTLQLGSEQLALSDMHLLLNYTRGTTSSLSLSGTLALAGTWLEMSYQYPGPFALRGQLPSLSMKTLVTHLCGGSVAWPAGFDIDLEQSTMLIQEQNGAFIVSLATEIKGFGLLACTFQRQIDWGFALGIDLDVKSLAALPGLHMLAPFDAFLGLDTLLLVFSSLAQQPDFQFPDLANFNVPSIGNRKLALPAQANGLTTGFNLYTRLNTSRSGAFRALAKYLRINLNGNLGITLAISLPDPVTSSKFFLSVNAEIQKGTTLVGELGGFLQGSDIGAFLTAVVKTKVQGQSLEFDVSALVLENGVLISGTMQGTIQFSSIHLSNLALVVGLDLEGIPSLGIAATLDVSTFESSLAIFFDSADPAKSLVAGALSNLSLLDIAHTFAGQASIPQELVPVLKQIALHALNAFSMPASVAPSLDKLDVAGISRAFKQYGNVTIPSTGDRILLIINQQGASWHLTDLSTMKHYHLALQGGQISVTLDPQLYLAPQQTSIGALQYPLGFNVMAQIDFILLHALLNIQISPSQGIFAEVDLAPITLLNPTFFALTGANAQGGPRLSLATYSRPQVADPRLRDPHALVSGEIWLLGADLAAIYVLLNEQGFIIQVKAQVNPVLHVDLNGSINLQGHLALQGGLSVGIARTLDLGKLGSLSVNTQVNGQLSVAYAPEAPPTGIVAVPPAGIAAATIQRNPLVGPLQKAAGGDTVSASLSGGFAFQGTTYTIPTLTLDVNGPALQNIAETLWQRITATFNDLLQSSDQWLTWVHSGVISGVDTSAVKIVSILSSVYHLSAADIATKMKQVGYGAAEVTEALLANGLSVVGSVSSTASSVGQTLDDTAKKGVDDLKKGFDDLMKL